jgi:hypothetical protein
MANIKGVRQVLPNCTVATLPSAAAHKGDVVFVTNALKASETTGTGTGNLAFSDGTNWCRVDTGAAVAA